MPDPDLWSCSFDGCSAKSNQPTLDGWTQITGWRGVKSGVYCPNHAAALEAVCTEGGIEDPENDLGEDTAP
jgi:hypothetical protein